MNFRETEELQQDQSPPGRLHRVRVRLREHHALRTILLQVYFPKKNSLYICGNQLFFIIFLCKTVEFFYKKIFNSQDKSRKKTIIPLLPGARIGQRETLSALDCMKLNAQYGCFDRADPWKNKKIQAICGLMGFSYQN